MKKLKFTIMNKETLYYYFREYFDFHIAVWNYIKHLYPEQKVGDKMQFSYTVPSEDLKEIYHNKKFLIDLKKVDEIFLYNKREPDFFPHQKQLRDLKTVKIASYKKKTSNNHYDFNSEDFEKIIMLFWVGQQMSVRVKTVEKQYDHYVMLSVHLISSKLEGIQKVNFETITYNPAEEAFKRVLTDVLRVRLTGCSPTEY